ncbi:hypothetical protein VCRA2128O305_310023 [Vibrio crassostreae]|nr:hypothetical protein EDB45_12820 [Vibrio crassostreae]CAK1951338.1 hypothetical protein VCRA2113O221_280047 [Vibrio crassostreae]CAK1951442.1 hypothetical protein VCRA2113O222_280047 [Vibrio crassostreae]CAK2026733.1 hypothetical protein VCRA2116O234_320023 [Vibrio crassostreae]CAK2036499.1 hypothetical protein VCRA2112O187_370023 [Vibrio crassostreae]
MQHHLYFFHFHFHKDKVDFSLFFLALFYAENQKKADQDFLHDAELSLSTVTDGEVLPNLLKQTRRSILEVAGDGAYDTRACHAAIKIKRAVALIPPR